MLKSRTRLALVAALLAANVAHAAKPDEAKLLATLKNPQASRFDKATACRLLSRVGTKAAVPTLAGLLADDEMHHMARYALEPIPDPAVDEALRAALGTLKGKQLIGVIGSVGVRKDVKGIDALAKFLAAKDTILVRTAARSLGRIGTAEAADALSAALPKASQDTSRAVCEGLFRCAEAFAESGDKEKALAVYGQLRGLKNAPHQIRAGALRGAVITRGVEGIPLMVEAIRGDDYILTAAAARAAMEMDGPEVTKALAAELPKLSVKRQILLTLVMGNRRDAGALPALLALAKKGDKAARVAALRATVEVGGAAAVPVFLSLMADPEAEVAAAAQAGLGALSGPEVDAAIVAMLADKDPKTRLAAIELLGGRGAGNTAPAFLKAAADPDDNVRMAGIKALGAVAGIEQFPALVEVLVKAKSTQEGRTAEAAVVATCSRLSRSGSGSIVIRKAVYCALAGKPGADVTKKVAKMVKAGATSVDASNDNFGDPAQGLVKKFTIDYTVDGVPFSKTVKEKEKVSLTAKITPPACVDALCTALPKAPKTAKLGLLRILRTAGGPKALAAVRGAMADGDAEIAGAALSLVCNWPSVDVLPELTRLAKTTKDRKTKILALRGCIRLIPQQKADAATKLAGLKEAMGLAERDEEKRLVLSAFGAIHTPEALAAILPHLDSPALKEEASVAAMVIAEEIVGRSPAEVAAAMEKVAKATSDTARANRAKRLGAQAKGGGKPRRKR